jgi:hypothetical protein
VTHDPLEMTVSRIVQNEECLFFVLRLTVAAPEYKFAIRTMRTDLYG